MNKEILKTIGVWLLGILLCISIIFGATVFAACMKLRSQNIALRNENEEVKNELMDKLYEVSSLEPCPMCEAEVKLFGTDSFYIDCDKFDDNKGCGLKTGYYKSKMKLVEDWNSIPRK